MTKNYSQRRELGYQPTENIVTKPPGSGNSGGSSEDGGNFGD